MLVLKVRDNREVRLKLLNIKGESREVQKLKKLLGSSKVIKNEVYVAMYFKRSIELRKLRAVMTVDLNFNIITLAVFTTSGS